MNLEGGGGRRGRQKEEEEENESKGECDGQTLHFFGIVT